MHERRRCAGLPSSHLHHHPPAHLPLQNLVREFRQIFEPRLAGHLVQHLARQHFGDALPGRNWVERVGGSIEELTATDAAEMNVGDRFVIETPGGGGFGAPE